MANEDVSERSSLTVPGERLGYSLRETFLSDPLARALEQQLIAETKSRYGERGQSPLESAAFDPPGGCFLLVMFDDEPIACGGFRQLLDDRAEIKRMYVDPNHRGRGVGRYVLDGLEDRARSRGYKAIWLETGIRQPEAIELYSSAGYVSIEPYGEFKFDERSRCFAHALVSAAQDG